MEATSPVDRAARPEVMPPGPGPWVSPGSSRSALHRLMTGYISSKAMFVALELRLFDALEESPSTAEELAAQLNLAARPTRILLLALVGLRLVHKVGDGYRNLRLASTFLVSTKPQFMGPFATHQDTHFTKFSHLTDSLRENKAVTLGENYSAAFGAGDDWARRLVRVARTSAILQADNLAAKASLKGHRHMVDLGTGSAAYSLALARANPNLRVTAVDQPAICQVAEEYVAEAGLTHRISVHPANIWADTFPGCDLALLSHVLGGFGGPEKSRRLLKHIYDWLPAGGELLIHGHVPARSKVPFPYLMGLILIVNNTQDGEIYDEEVICAWLAAAGFPKVSVTVVSPISALIRATK